MKSHLRARALLLSPFKKIRSAWIWLSRQRRIDPFRYFAILALVILTLVGTGKVISGHISERSAANAILSLPTLRLAELREKLDSGQVRKALRHTLNDGTLLTPSTKHVHEIELANGSRYTIDSELLKNETASKAFFERALKDTITLSAGLEQGGKGNRLDDFLFFVLYIAFFIILILIFQRAAQDLLVGKSFSPKTMNFDVDFDDIIGYEPVKQEFKELISALSKPARLARHGMRAPKGILLTGAPGVGKTMFAKALANECGARFLYATGSDFVEMYVGVGARRARALFQEARHSSPTIIFIDEIDALGSRSGYGMDSERLSTINQMLAEMDGINENKLVVVIGATNHPEKLDPALLRPGRFDKKIHIPSPDASTREALLRHYLDGSSLDPAMNLAATALRLPGMSGADIQNLAHQAKNLALRQNPDEQESLRIDQAILDEAHEILLMGLGKNAANSMEIERVAFHELGHALIAKLLCPALEVEKVAIEGRGDALGFTMQRPAMERRLFTEEEMLAQIATLFGGRAAEHEMMGQASSGAADDLRRASELATRMVCELGFGPRVGLRVLAQNDPRGMNLPPSAEADIEQILATELARAREVIRAHKEWMLATQKRLLERKSMSAAELFSTLPQLH